MSRHMRTPEPDAASIGSTLSWLGGGQTSTSTEARDRASYQVAGVVVVLNGLLAWLVATVAIAVSTSWPILAILPFTLVVGLLAAALARAIAGGNRPTLSGLLGRAAVALFMAVVLGELASIGIFNGSINGALEDKAVAQAATAPAVVAATGDLDRAHADRARLDTAVSGAQSHLDEALVVARCEFNPSPACPPQKITGVPGSGPETRTANELLDGAKRELDVALTNRDRQAPGIDAEIDQAEAALSKARAEAPAQVDTGLGAHWTAMHDYTVANFGALMLRLITIAFFALLSLLPLLLKLWRGETAQDREVAARALQDRAELEAETAIAVKRAEVRAEAEKLWAEQKLTSARFAVEAQTAIERESQRRRVAAAFEGEYAGAQPNSELPPSLVRPMAELPAAPAIQDADIEDATLEDPPIYTATKNLPVAASKSTVPAHKEVQPPARSIGLPRLNPIPDLTRAVTGFGKSLVPPVITRTINNSNPVKTARTVMEEFEEIKFSFTRKRTVTVDEPVHTETSSSAQQLPDDRGGERALPRVTTTRVVGSNTPQYDALDASAWETDALPAGYDEDLAPSLSGREGDRELAERKGPRELRNPHSPWELPPGS